MNPPKYNEYDYIDFLVGAQRVYSCLEAERVQPSDKKMPSHDSINRLLYRLEPGSEPLWKEVKPYVNKSRGMLIIDDSTLDKIYSKKIELVTHHWSGKHHRVVKGINLISLLWTDGDNQIPCDYRVYAKENDGFTKNDHFRAMLKQAKDRGFSPAYVSFDSWYSSLENLKTIRDYGWLWLTRFKSNRLVNPDNTGNRPLSEVKIACQGTIVHLKGYGMIKIFKIVSQNGLSTGQLIICKQTILASLNIPNGVGRSKTTIEVSSNFVELSVPKSVAKKHKEIILAYPFELFLDWNVAVLELVIAGLK